MVNYYAEVFLLRPPDLLRRGPFSERENVCNSQENGVRTRCAAIVNHRAIVKILRVVNLLRVVFLVRWGPLGGGGLCLVWAVFWVFLGFLREILVCCGGLWAGGHGHVCWAVSIARALTFNDKCPSFQPGVPDQAMIPGT